LAIALPWAYGQAGNLDDLQHKLNASFKITTMTDKHSEIDTAGDVVELHKDGLRMSALATVLTESNTYKDGKIGGGGAKRAWGSFGTVMLQGMAGGLDPTGMVTVPDGIPPRTLAAGDRCWVLAITAQKDGVVFKLLTDPDANGMRYHGDLKILFPNKKQMPTADAALQLIAEVLSVVPVEQLAPVPAQSDAGQSAFLEGKYIENRNKTDFIELGPDGEFTLFQGGKMYGGAYEVAGDTVVVAGPQIKGMVQLQIVGRTLTYHDGTIYEKQAEADVAPPAPPQRQYDELAPPPPPPPPPAPPATPPNR
jgi:hypothetical protein